MLFDVIAHVSSTLLKDMLVEVPKYYANKKIRQKGIVRSSGFSRTVQKLRTSNSELVINDDAAWHLIPQVLLVFPVG